MFAGALSIGIILIGGFVLPSLCGMHDSNNKKLLESRPYIITAINSGDLELHDQAVKQAIAYNDRVAKGKRHLANPWINWFTDRIWKDAEFIPLDYSDVKIKE